MIHFGVYQEYAGERPDRGTVLFGKDVIRGQEDSGILSAADGDFCIGGYWRIARRLLWSLRSRRCRHYNLWGSRKRNSILAQCAIYLATAPKSNSTLGIGAAISDIERLGNLEVPNHLKDASRDSKALGHGKGYKYPHDFPEHFVVQQYLPDGVEDKIYYQPGTLGAEREISERVRIWRERMGKKPSDKPESD